jgi:hypothetical protein
VNKARMGLQNATEVNQQWASAQEARRRQLEREVARDATGLSNGYAFDTFERYEFFRAVMERDARPLGFYYDDAASSVRQYIF